MSEIRKAVIPAAGSGSRLKPLSDYISKPMMPLGKKPVLQHIIEELQDAGIKEIAVVAKSDDRDMMNYFKKDTAVTFIIDDTFSGPGGAILKAQDFVGKDQFIVAFSDSLLRGKQQVSYIKKLMTLMEKQETATALAIYPIPKSEISSRGVIKCDTDPKYGGDPVRLTDIFEKPSRDIENPWAVACRYVLDESIFEILKGMKPDEDGERQLTPAIRKLISMNETVLGYPLAKGLKRYDTGNFESYFKAQKAFMKKVD